MGRVNGEVHALLVAKDGQGRQYRIDASAGAPTGMEVRRFAVGSQSEGCVFDDEAQALYRSEEHTSELQSLMRISYAVFCLKNKKKKTKKYRLQTTEKSAQTITTET